MTTAMRTRKIHSIAARRYRRARQLGTASALGEHLGAAAGLHRHAEQAVGGLHRALLVAHDEQLGLVAELGNEGQEAMQVDVVERRLDLVHHVERRRPAAEHGEEERQRGQAALATRQQRQLLDVLPARLGLDLDAGLQQVIGLGEHEPPRPAREEVAEEGRKVIGDVGIGGGEDRLDLMVDGLDDPRELTTGRAHVLELLVEEGVTLLQLGELLEGQRVDRPEQAQFPIQLAYPALRCDAVGKWWRLGSLGDVGLDVAVVAQHLHGRLDAQTGLGLLDLGAPGLLANLVELSFGEMPAATCLLEAGGQRPDLLAVEPAPDGERAVQLADHRSSVVDEGGEPVQRRENPLDRGASLFGGRHARRRQRAGDVRSRRAAVPTRPPAPAGPRRGPRARAA